HNQTTVTTDEVQESSSSLRYFLIVVDISGGVGQSPRSSNNKRTLVMANFNTLLAAVATAAASIVFGMALGQAGADRLPDAFQQAASVGRFTQEQAASACTHAEARLNRQLKEARGDNAFTLAQ